MYNCEVEKQFLIYTVVSQVLLDAGCHDQWSHNEEEQGKGVGGISHPDGVDDGVVVIVEAADDEKPDLRKEGTWLLYPSS